EQLAWCYDGRVSRSQHGSCRGRTPLRYPGRHLCGGATSLYASHSTVVFARPAFWCNCLPVPARNRCRAGGLGHRVTATGRRHLAALGCAAGRRTMSARDWLDKARCRGVLDALDVMLAQSLVEKAGEGNEQLLWLVALLSYQHRQGHVCIDLQRPP